MTLPRFYILSYHSTAPDGSEAGRNMVLAILYETLLGSKRVRGTTPIVNLVKVPRDVVDWLVLTSLTALF